METIFAWLCKCILSSGILTAYYWISLRNKKFHYYNRFYLLSILLISLIIPFLHFRWFSLERPGVPYLDNLMYTIGSPGEAPRVAAAAFSLEWIPAGIGMLVSTALFGVLCLRIARICNALRTHARIRMKGFYLVETRLPNAPFSFLNYLFWRNDIPLISGDGEKILRHELTHIEGKHTYDKLFAQLLICFFWMNPFYWLIQKELNMIHEFIADEASVEEGDTAAFARILLQSYNKGAYLDPSHSFFYSPIKRRLIMITQSKNTSYSYLRRVSALPVILLAASLFSFTIVRAQADTNKKQDAASLEKIAAEKLSAEKIARDDDERNGRSMNPKLRSELFDMRKTENEAEGAERTMKLTKAILNDPPDIIYWVNGRESSAPFIKTLKIENIATINVFTGASAVKKYGEKARGGVVEFTTKN